MDIVYVKSALSCSCGVVIGGVRVKARERERERLNEVRKRGRERESHCAFVGETI